MRREPCVRATHGPMSSPHPGRPYDTARANGVGVITTRACTPIPPCVSHRYDAFPCQHQIFYPGKAVNSMWYDPVFKVETVDGRQVCDVRKSRARS